jgi:hypothetical protein
MRAPDVPPRLAVCAALMLLLACSRPTSPVRGEPGTAAPSGVHAEPSAAALADPTRVEPAGYLVAIDTPTRTYLDYVHVSAPETFRPDRDGWPLLAQWNGKSAASAVRFVRFAPGQTPSVAQIQTLLPKTGPASERIDITAAPYGARASPADATAPIQAALDAARRLAGPSHPVDVVVPRGTYRYGAVLEIGPDVRLRGDGGVLHATHPESAAVHLAGDRSGALFLTIESEPSSRGTTPDSSGIWVGPRSALGGAVHDTLVVGNEIIQPMGAHVFGMAEVGGTWAFNYAHDGFADGFHHTGGSSQCQVVANRASGSATRGDDLYAFVGYAGQGEPVHHCSCVGNWGRDGHARGLAAVGAGFIDFQDNDIERTQAAGIYVAHESSYKTFGAFDITVLRNRIASANLASSHDGLLAFADAPEAGAPSRTFGMIPNAIRRLIVKDNTFTDIAPGVAHGLGIEIRDGCEGGEVSGNTVTRSASPGIVVHGKGFAVGANAVGSP